MINPVNFQSNAVDLQGNVLPGAVIEVRNVSTGALVSLYSDLNNTGISNPFNANALGFFQFFCESQTVNIAAMKDGVSVSWDDIFLNDKSNGFTLTQAITLPLEIGSSITTTGYHTVNDGGAGQYIVVGENTGTDDGGSYLNMVNGNQLELINDGSVSVLQFGAKGDGATDNTLAIQNTFDYAKKIHIPEGLFVVGNPGISVRDGTTVLGTGPESSVLKKKAGLSELDPILREINTGTDFLTVKDFTMYDMGLIGNGDQALPSASGSGLLRFYSSENLALYRCSFSKSKSYGVGLQGNAATSGTDKKGPNINVYIENCLFFENGLQEYLIGSDTSDGIDFKSSDRATFLGCKAWNNGDKGFDIRARQLSMTDCYSFENNGSGFALQIEPELDATTNIEPATAILAGCFAKDNLGNGFSVVPQVRAGVINGLQFTTFSSCESFGNTHNYAITSEGTNVLAVSTVSMIGCRSINPLTGTRHFLGSGAADEINISGCTFKGGDDKCITISADQSGPLNISGSLFTDLADSAINSSTHVDANTLITGCIFRNINGAALQGASNCTVSGNDYINVSSTTLLSLSGTNNRVYDKKLGPRNISSQATLPLDEKTDVFYLLGTTNITDIAPSWGGRIITLIFKGTITIFNGNSLKLSGDISGVNDSTISLIFGGGLWYEVSRSIHV